MNVKLSDFISKVSTNVSSHHRAPVLNKARFLPVKYIGEDDHAEHPGEVKSVRVANHVLERWNERVGPVTTENQLYFTLSEIIIHHQYRVQFCKDTKLVIDNDIVFGYGYDKETGRLTIVTCLGRLRLQPVLNCHIKSGKDSKRMRGILEISEEELQSQVMPAVPNEIFLYKGTTDYYRMDVYVMEDNRVEVSIFVKRYRKRPWQLQTTSIHKDCFLSSRALKILYTHGYREITGRYIKANKEERYQRAISIYGEDKVKAFFTDNYVKCEDVEEVTYYD